MAFPGDSGDSLDRYLQALMGKKGTALPSSNAPATRASMPPSRTPSTNVTPGPMTQLGQGAMGMGQNFMNQQGNKALYDYLRGMMNSPSSTTGDIGAMDSILAGNGGDAAAGAFDWSSLAGGGF